MKKIILLLLIFGALGSLVVLKTYQLSVEASPSPDTVTDSFTDETKVGLKENLYINTTAGQIMLGILCYCDKDVDGYYATTTTIVSAGTCSQGGCSGSRGNDCDDNNASIYPGVQVGTKDCSGNNYYFISGTQSATTTSYCKLRTYNSQPIICQSDGTYSDPACSSYSDITKVSCGSCKYVNQCDALAQTCANYSNGTKYSSCKWCQNGAIANIPSGQDPFNDCYPYSGSPCRGEVCDGSGYCTKLPAGNENYCPACTKCDGKNYFCTLGPEDLYAVVCCTKYPNYSKDTTPKISPDPYGRDICNTSCLKCCYNGKCDAPWSQGAWTECMREESAGAYPYGKPCDVVCAERGKACYDDGHFFGRYCYSDSSCTNRVGANILCDYWGGCEVWRYVSYFKCFCVVNQCQ